MDQIEYRIVIEPLPEEEGGGYLATVPDLPGCMSDGETPAEALAAVQDAVVSWLAEATTMGRPIPKPQRQRQYA